MSTWRRIIITSLILLSGLGLGLIRPVYAADGLVVPCDVTTVTGGVVGVSNPCTISDFFNQFIVLSQYGLTLVIVLGDLMMVYGGFQFITAGGRPSKIDEGKRVILGTIIGLIVSFSAFVIINFAVAAITGSKLAAKNLNPFGAVARVFVNDKNLNRPFNSLGDGGTGDTSCNGSASTWDKLCGTAQIHCADADKSGSAIHDLQTALNTKNCTLSPGIRVDGCFGTLTFTALRKFQIVNQLPPTGQLDDRTASLLNTGGKNCSDNQPLVDAVNQVLPAAQDTAGSSTETGCCVIKNTDNTGTEQALFCANDSTQRTCAAVGGEFHADVTSCTQDSTTRDTCGYCYKTSGTGGCFQIATNYWCTQIITAPFAPMSFQAGRTCNGESRCAGGNANPACTDGLLNYPP